MPFLWKGEKGTIFGENKKKTPSGYRKRFAVIWFRKYQFGFTAGIAEPP